ncbi:MAG: TetR/AcrR family transcriptional regulator [Pseudomonadota bacterium]
MTTKTKILDAAEALFADFGFAGTSLRAITQRAEVNLASVNYHFGSKESLVQSVLQRKSAPLNETRINRLQQVLDAGNPRLEDLLTAFVSPALELTETDEGERYIKLLARIALEPEGTLREGLNAQYEAVMDFFMPPLREHLPDLDGEVLLWRIHFLLGTLGYCMAGSDAVLLKSQGDLFDRTNAETMIHRLVEFMAAGLRAPQVDVA